MRVRIKAKQNASKRTKNRIREHGPFFDIQPRLDGVKLFRSGAWFGWLPENELEIEMEKPPKARVNKEGFMHSASREHRVKKGKGSFQRRKKHQKKLDSNQ
jgi:hypothetical protein